MPPGYVENTGPPSIRSSTFDAPRVVQCSCTCVGALHETGDDGPVSATIATVEELGATVVEAAGAAMIVVVDGCDSFALLEHAPGTRLATKRASGASRTLDIGRS